jgi:uncharacterized protein YqhQ
MNKRGKITLLMVMVLIILVSFLSVFVLASSTTNVYNTYVTKEVQDNEDESLDEEKETGKSSGITGAVIGVRELISGWKLIAVIGMFIGLFAVYIVSKTKLALKKK